MGRRGVNLAVAQALPMPSNAWRIADARRDGFRPAETVIVSYVGDTPWQGPHVFCESGKRYSWDWARDLPIAIALSPGVDATDAIRGCFWPMAPSFLTLIDVEQCRVSHVLRLLPQPKLWHLADVSAYFPELTPCN